MPASLVRGLMLLLIVWSQGYQIAALENPKGYNLFTRDLLPVMAENKLKQNIVYSPASIYSFLAFSYFDVVGNTAEETRRDLRLGEHGKLDSILEYESFLKTTLNKGQRKAKGSHIILSDNIFINKKDDILSTLTGLAASISKPKVGIAYFDEDITAAKEVNKCVERHTENNIQNLMQPDAINNNISAILVNSIYLKSNWSYLTDSPRRPSKPVSRFGNNLFNYVSLPQLNAQAIEIPYENRDISMMIIMPNEVDGLGALINGLKDMDLNAISSMMKKELLNLVVPKFRVEFEIDMKEPLKKMGISSVFVRNTGFTPVFKKFSFFRISNMKHKTFLQINAFGSEAAAATCPDTSNTTYTEQVGATHPFVFFIRSKSVVYFAGHIVKLP